jgi:hypothetical protein
MKNYCSPILLILIFVFCHYRLNAQGYQALHGSPYAGSTAVFNNPAASVNSAYPWEITLFSAQVKSTTNAFYLKNFSLANQTNAALTARDGMDTRFEHMNLDLSLFNVLYKIDKNHAVNFNLRGRTYNHVRMLPFNFIDSSVKDFNSFLIANRNTQFIEGYATHTGWIEADLNYSQVLMETNHSRLSGGISLRIMKSVSGVYAKLNKLSYLEFKNGTDTNYTFTNGTGAVAFSDNYDNTDNVKDFLKRTRTGLGLNMGLEYLIYNRESDGISPNNNLNYDWKFGLSIMDIGATGFSPSAYSSMYSSPDPTITDGQLADKINGAQDIRGLRDSLSTVFTQSIPIADKFSISNPTRLVLNIDRNLGNHFFVNGELSLNFFSPNSYTKLRTRELNLLTVTPRWETIGFGAYLPVQYTAQGQFWIGAALKTGPLVLGVHNLAIFKQDPYLSGGAYLMLSIHPFNKTKIINKLDCSN